MKIHLILLSLLCLVLSGVAQDEGFARYQIIIDKHPFGEEPPEAATTQVSINESFARDLRLSMIYEGAQGDLRVGIVNNSTGKNYLLRVGETEDNIELVEANILASEALLRKGNEVALFPPEKGAPEMVSNKKPPSKRSSYTERRRAIIRKTKNKPEQPQLTGAALREHLENVQMNIIRNGQPPLPMPLTPEMDAQLVSEGVLDPQ